MNENTTTGSTIRHAVTGAVGSLLAVVVSTYLGVPQEVSVPVAPSLGSALLGGLYRWWMGRAT